MSSSLSTSSTAWALRLSPADASHLGALRLIDGLEVVLASDALWLRGRSRSETLDTLLRALPALQRYHWENEHALRPANSLLASEKLPDATWQSLRTWLTVELPVSRLPGLLLPIVPLELKACARARPPNAALLSISTWLSWAASAPEVRLKALRFATLADGQCLVLGSPLPSVPCRHLIEDNGIIIPAGQAWVPAVSVATLRRFFRTADQAKLWWDESGVRHLPGEFFVAASRASVRATAEALKELHP